MQQGEGGGGWTWDMEHRYLFEETSLNICFAEVVLQRLPFVVTTLDKIQAKTGPFLAEYCHFGANLFLL